MSIFECFFNRFDWFSRLFQKMLLFCGKKRCFSKHKFDEKLIKTCFINQKIKITFFNKNVLFSPVSVHRKKVRRVKVHTFREQSQTLKQILLQKEVVILNQFSFELKVIDIIFVLFLLTIEIKSIHKLNLCR